MPHPIHIIKSSCATHVHLPQLNKTASTINTLQVHAKGNKVYTRNSKTVKLPAKSKPMPLNLNKLRTIKGTILRRLNFLLLPTQSKTKRTTGKKRLKGHGPEHTQYTRYTYTNIKHK